MLSSSFLVLSLFPFLVRGLPLPPIGSSVFPGVAGPLDIRQQNVFPELQTLFTRFQSSTLVPTSTVSPAIPPTSTVPAPTVSSPAPLLLLPSDNLSRLSASSQAQVEAPLVMAYYPDWVGSSFTPEEIDFKKFDCIDFAFALLDQNFNLTWDDPVDAPALLQRLVNAAHPQNTCVKLSIGGWTGSKYFSSAVSTNETRQLFARNVLGVYHQYGLDGIDIDWEYPGHEGLKGNQFNPNDTTNFLSFLQLLRETLPSTALITAAAQTSPFTGNDGNPIQDASQFAKVLNWILLMNYDVWGSSPNPGPNAPLYDRCGNSTQPDGNVVSGFNSWTAAGFPAKKIVLGLPSYGYISASSAIRLRTRSESPSRLLALRSEEDPAQQQQQQQNVTVTDPDGSGQVQFRNLVSEGALVRNTNDSGGPLFVGAGGFIRYWDNCSSTPFLRSESAKQVITYDDPESLAMKAMFVNHAGMLGVNLFDVHGDTSSWDLIDAISTALE